MFLRRSPGDGQTTHCLLRRLRGPFFLLVTVLLPIVGLAFDLLQRRDRPTGDSTDRCDIIILHNNVSSQCLSSDKVLEAHPLYLATEQTDGAQLRKEDILVPSNFGKMYGKPHLHHVARTEDLRSRALNPLAGA